MRQRRPEPSIVYPIRLEPQFLRNIKTVAERSGEQTAPMIRNWIRRGLRETQRELRSLGPLSPTTEQLKARADTQTETR
jgi:hypothetical protein